MRNVGRRPILTALSFAMIPFGVAQAADPAALVPIRSLVETLLSVMKQGKSTPFETRMAALAPVIDRTFDLDAILRASVGSSYASIEPAKLAALTAAFRDYTVASYVGSFDTFTGQRFDVLPETSTLENGNAVAKTRIVPVSGESHELDYVLHAQGATWRIVDVLADGSISRVAVQRSDFRRLMAEGGVTTLIASLQAKTRSLATQ